MPDTWSGLKVRTNLSAKLGHRTAVFSQDERYRYLLLISWDRSRLPLMVAGLNPSTADENQNDPTISRLICFGKEWGNGGLIMTNLSAFRSTDPKGMLAQEDQIGEHNTVEALTDLARQARDRIVIAWGGNAKKMGKWPEALLSGLRKNNVELMCFKQNGDGTPSHPLYLAGSTKLVQFNFRPEEQA